MAHSELRAYFTSVASIPLLTPNEEAELFRQLKLGDESVRSRLAEANQRLVIKIASAHLTRGLTFGDLIGEGNVGLMHAIERFDLSRQCRFSTYAIHWIRRAIIQAIQEKAHSIRVPGDLAGRVPRYRRTIAQLNDELDRRPTLGESARAMGVTKHTVRRLDRASHVLSSIQALPEHESTVLMTRTGVVPWLSAERVLEARDMVEVLMRAVTHREREILGLRFGLDGRCPMTLEEVGTQFNLTKARIGQIESQAMSKMAQKLQRTGN